MYRTTRAVRALGTHVEAQLPPRDELVDEGFCVGAYSPPTFALFAGFSSDLMLELDHAIREHLPGFICHVLGKDSMPDWPDFDPEEDSRADVERGRWLNDLRRLPGWLEPLERIGRLLEREGFLSARVDSILFDESYDG